MLGIQGIFQQIANLRQLLAFEHHLSRTRATIVKTDNNPFLWIGDGGKLTGGRLHIALNAPNRAAVDAFYAAAMAAGATDNGAPGLRAHYHPTYYAAFVYDPDGHNIEAVCHAPE